MKKMKAAFIGFTPHGLSFDETFDCLKKYHELGYAATEVGEFLLSEGDPAENVKRLESFGMKALLHTLPRREEPGFSLDMVPEVIEKCNQTGIRWAATYAGCVATYRFGGRPDYPGYDEVMRELETLNAIAKELAKEGITLTFHNHDAEFQTFYQGKPTFYHMVDNSEYLKFEVDTGWALYGHFDPVEVLDYVGDKLYAIHVKDWTYGNAVQTFPGRPVDENKAQNAMPHFTTPGNGFLPLRAILKKASEMGMEYAIIEQDFTDILDNENILRAAYLNMKETGFVE